MLKTTNFFSVNCAKNKLNLPKIRYCFNEKNEVIVFKDKSKLKREKKSERTKQYLANLAKKKDKDKPAVHYLLETADGTKKDTTLPLPDVYSSHYVEAAWYSWWQQIGLFNPDHSHVGKEADNFTVCLPPPNVTGSLHLGHALGDTIQDAICRWNRMKGRRVLWVPGCDHAGIATQAVVEKRLWREKSLHRDEIGREKFTDYVWEWKEKKEKAIHNQMKRLGLSLDWSRASFTLDKKHKNAVDEAFVRLYEKGLIYRKKQFVNWSCALGSVVSDIEVDHLSLDKPTALLVPGHDDKITFGVLHYIAYRVSDQPGKEIVVATTRPETLLGDVAIVVNPNDDRYRDHVGHHVIHPITNASLPLIGDSRVDPSFGTGAVKVTPAHDSIDYSIGIDNNLHGISIIDRSGRMTNVPEKYQGLKRFDVRRKIIHDLKDSNLYRGSNPNPMTLPLCSRSGDVIEPMLKEQWFVDMGDMAKSAIQAVTDDKLQIIPENYKKLWNHWLNNDRDWCISRQLWWGHRIPAYNITLNNTEDQHNEKTSHEWIAAKSYEEAVMKAERLTGVNRSLLTVEQDADVLDTWFSSALFPFSIFGWPDKTDDLNQFYPTSFLNTGNDIMFFWVARMVMMSQKLTGILPFKKVMFHSLIRDSHGRKMSKSLGNVIDPLDIVNGITLEGLKSKLLEGGLSNEEVERVSRDIDKNFSSGILACGADALRFTLASYNYTELFTNVDVTHFKSNRNFCNKIWQACRFVFSQIDKTFTTASISMCDPLLTPTDRWILHRLSDAIAMCDNGFRSYKLFHVTNSLHNFWVSDFCDIYLEYCKVPLNADDGSRERKNLLCNILLVCVDTMLRAMAPLTPYLAEELYQRLPSMMSHSTVGCSTSESRAESVHLTHYPNPDQFKDWNCAELDEEINIVRKISNTLLSYRAELHLTKQQKQNVLIRASETIKQQLSRHETAFLAYSRSGSLAFLSENDLPSEEYLKHVIDENTEIYLHISKLIDIEKVMNSLDKPIQNQENLLLDSKENSEPTEKIAAIEKKLQRLKNIKKHISLNIEM